MKMIRLFFLIIIASAFNATLFAADEVDESTNYVFSLPSKDSPEVKWWRDSQTNLDERLAWWRDARFGMFIHWGVYSGLGNQFHGQQGGGYAEHIQRILKIPIPTYRKEVAGNFNPTNFNADEWVRLACDAGMKYIVITAKHHDGFAMWPTKVNDYNVMDTTPWHHDPMVDLKAACDKYGIKFGFYYSQAFDWGNSNAPGNDWDYNNPGGDKKLGGTDWWNTRPEFMASARKYVDTKAIPQLQELIRLYHPAILWFDTAGKLPPSENLRIMKAVREADPNVVISGRLVNGWGDYADTTDRPANFPAHDGDWEGIPTTDESYGWNPFDQLHKPPSHFIQLLAKSAARGGNLLLNIGPMGDGNVDPKDVAILKGIGDWWKVNGESIRGTTRTPLPVQTWGESTLKLNPLYWQSAFWITNQPVFTANFTTNVNETNHIRTLYLHVFNWPMNGKLVVGGLKSDTKGANLEVNLHWGKPAPLVVTRLNPLDVSISVPSNVPDKVDSVVVLTLAGDIQADTNRLLQPEFPSDTLRTFDGELHGGLKFGPGKKTDDVVMNWTKENQSVTWPARLNEATTYEVFANYDAPEDSAGGTFTVDFGSQKLSGTVHANANKSVPLGKISLQPGIFEIKVVATKIVGGELFRLRNLELRPVASEN